MYDFLIMPWAIPVICGCVVAAVAIIFGTLKSAYSELAETRLKQSMVDQGFTAAEIERVVTASASGDGRSDFALGDRLGKVPPLASKQAV